MTSSDSPIPGAQGGAGTQNGVQPGTSPGKRSARNLLAQLAGKAKPTDTAPQQSGTSPDGGAGPPRRAPPPPQPPPGPPPAPSQPPPVAATQNSDLGRHGSLLGPLLAAGRGAGQGTAQAQPQHASPVLQAMAQPPAHATPPQRSAGQTAAAGGAQAARSHDSNWLHSGQRDGKAGAMSLADADAVTAVARRAAIRQFLLALADDSDALDHFGRVLHYSGWWHPE